MSRLAWLSAAAMGMAVGAAGVQAWDMEAVFAVAQPVDGDWRCLCVDNPARARQELAVFLQEGPVNLPDYFSEPQEEILKDVLLAQVHVFPEYVTLRFDPEVALKRPVTVGLLRCDYFQSTQIPQPPDQMEEDYAYLGVFRQPPTKDNFGKLVKFLTEAGIIRDESAQVSVQINKSEVTEEPELLLRRDEGLFVGVNVIGLPVPDRSGRIVREYRLRKATGGLYLREMRELEVPPEAE